MAQNKLLVKLDNAGVYKSPKWLVRGISFEINEGQIVTLIGPNGSCLLYTSPSPRDRH